MNAIFFALITYFGWGVGDVFGAIASRKIGGFQTTFWIMLGATILFAPLTIPYWHTLITAPVFTILITFLIGFFFQSGNFAVNQALRLTDASIVLTTMGSFGALIVLFSTLFLHEPMSLLLVLIIVCIFVGVFLCTYNPAASTGRNHIQGVWYAVYSAISFGIFFTVVKTLTPTLSWFWPIYLSFFWLPLFYIYLKKIDEAPTLSDFKHAGVPLIGSLVV